jgi:hypothetical protein
VARCRHHWERDPDSVVAGWCGSVQTPLGARSGQCGGWVMCGSLPATLSRLHGLTAHQTVDVKDSGNFLNAPCIEVQMSHLSVETKLDGSFRPASLHSESSVDRYMHCPSTARFCYLFPSALFASFIRFLSFLSFRATLCFTNLDYHLIPSPPVTPVYEGS